MVLSSLSRPPVDLAGRHGGHVAEMQRRRLLSAMVEVLAEQGLEGAGVGRVCKRAGVSRRTFYDLFDDRETCFLAAFDLAIKRLADRVAPAWAGAGCAVEGVDSGVRVDGSTRRADGQRMSWRERVRGALTVLLECFDEEPALAQLCLVETLKGAPQTLARRRWVLDVLAAVVDEGRGEAKSAPPPLTAESTVGGVVAVIHARVLARTPIYARAPVYVQDGAPAPFGVSPAGGDSGLGDPSLAGGTHGSLVELASPLMSMIVHPYLGSAASRRELERPTPVRVVAARGLSGPPAAASDPFKDLPVRITFRTARVIDTIGAQPGASNREIAQTAGVTDQGQMSKLLRRLENARLIENHGEGQAKGEPNAWRLTPLGQGVLQAVTV
jgi:AcrR family transcriptional regulator